MNTHQNCNWKAARLLLATFVVIGLFTQPLAFAATSWTGTTNTAWGTGTNWSSGVPTSADVAVFDSIFSNQPAYSGATSVAGLWLATGVGQDVSITSGLGALTLTGTSTINGNANTAILLDDTANHSLSIPGSNPVVTLANSTQFLVNNAGTLTIFKTNLNGNTLTLGGTNAAGNINFTSVIGTTNTAGSIIVNTAGTVTLSNSAGNTFTGGITLTNGTLRAAGNSGNMLGAGTLSLGGGELQLVNDAGLAYNRNTTVTGNTKITSNRLTTGAGVNYTVGALSIGAQTLTIAKGGNVNSGTAGVTFGATTLTGDSTFSLGSGTKLTLAAVTNGANTATFTGAGDFAQTGVWGGGTGGIILDAGFSGTVTLNQANTFTGGLTIKSGTVITSSSTATHLGIGTVTLGDSSGGSNSATLINNRHGISYANAIVLASNTTGTLSVSNMNAAVTFTGGVTGTNDLTINETGTNIITFSTTAINNTGKVIHTGIGLGTSLITGGIGSNVTEVIQNSATSGLTLSTTALDVNSSGTTLTNNTSGSALLTLSGGTSGTGNLILNNHSATANGVTLSTTALNHTGTITNSGSGSGVTLISAVIGTNVTGVVQDSATSTLNLTGVNTFAGGLTIKKGTVQLGNVAGAGTGTITLGDTSGTTAATLMLTGLTTYANALALGSGGTLTLINNTANNTVFSGGVTGTNDLTINNNNVGGGAISMSGLINNVGKLTFNGTAAGFNLLTGGIGANVTDLILNSNTSALTVSGGLAVNSSGTTLTNNGTKLFTVSGGTTGTGNLILKNNDSLANGLTLSMTAINHAGSITNSGTGTGATLISAAIGANVTSVTQNSATSGLVLMGNSAFTGPVTLTTGTLTASGSANALGTGAATLILNGGTLDFNHSSGLSFNRNTTIGGNVAIVSERNAVGAGLTYTLGTLGIGANTLEVNGGNINSGTATLTFGATTFSGNSIFNVINPIAGGTTLLTLGALNDGGAIARTITKSGDGSMTLGTAATSLIAGTTVNLTGGTLNLTNASALGSFASVNVSSGATFHINTVSTTIGGLGDGTGGGTVTNTSGTRIITLGNAGNYSFSGSINNTVGITKTGTGTQTLSGDNTYTSATLVNLGTLALTNNGTTGSLGGSAVTVGNATVTAGVSGNATLQVKGNYTIGSGALGTLTLVGGNGTTSGQGTLDMVDGVANTLTLSNSSTTTDVLKIGGVSASNTQSILNLEVGATSDQIAVTSGKVYFGAGLANINLTGLGNLSGTTQTLISGTISSTASFKTYAQMAAGATLNTSGNFSGYVLSLSSTTGSLTLTETANAAAANAYYNGAAALVPAQGGTTAFNSFVNGNTNTSNFGIGAGGTGNMNGQLAGTTNVFFDTNIVAPLSTSLGQNLSINSLNLNTASAVTIGGANTLMITAAAVNGNTAGNGITVASGSGNHVLNTKIALVNDQTWTVTGVGTTLTASNEISGVGKSLTKGGDGVLILSGTNTYTGATNISVGTLIVNGSLSNASLVTVASGATLKGSGSLGDLLVQSGGTHAPGNSPGLQTVTGNASYASGSTFAFELNKNIALTSLQLGPTYDFDQVAAGTLDITSGAVFTITLNGAGSAVDFTNSFWTSNQQWLVFGVSGAGTGNFTLGAISADSQGQSYGSYGSFDLQNLSGDIYLSWNAAVIPEPSSASLLLIGSGLGFLTLFRRRRI